jgi:hypothetical protein
MTRRKAAIATALAFLLLSGLVHGLWTDRWGNSEVLQSALARVEDVPMQIGSWKAEVQEVDAEPFRRAGAQAHWVRSYTDAKTGASVVVILMCGRAGRMAVHTPEVCYGAAGYELQEGSRPQRIPCGPRDTDQFWTARFGKATTAPLRLCWGWSAGKAWEAPNNPRWHFRGAPFLYKLYVIQDDSVASSPAVTASEQPLTAFFDDFLPALRTALLVDRKAD